MPHRGVFDPSSTVLSSLYIPGLGFQHLSLHPTKHQAFNQAFFSFAKHRTASFSIIDKFNDLPYILVTTSQIDRFRAQFPEHFPPQPSTNIVFVGRIRDFRRYHRALSKQFALDLLTNKEH